MTGIRFCPWYPLAAGAAHAPPAPGVYQVRIRTGLLAYPTGKSAMLHYGAGADVRSAIASFAAAHPDRDWLCRHALVAPGADPGAACRELVQMFARRFGCPPSTTGADSREAGHEPDPERERAREAGPPARPAGRRG